MGGVDMIVVALIPSPHVHVSQRMVFTGDGRGRSNVLESQVPHCLRGDIISHLSWMLTMWEVLFLAELTPRRGFR